MRRTTLSALVLLALSACGPAQQGEVEPNAIEQLPASFVLDVAAARGAVVAFLHGYANAANDDAEELLSVTGTEKIGRWVQWVDYQNQLFPGDIDGDVEIRQLEFVDFMELPGGAFGGQVNVDATVAFRTQPFQGVAGGFSREFVGPFIVTRLAPGRWAVSDGTRDGQSIERSIYPIQDEEKGRGGVVVRLDSVFAFPGRWQVNLFVSNKTGKLLSLRAKEALLVSPNGREVSGIALGVAESLAAIPSRSRIPGGVVFDAQPSSEGLSLRLPFRSRKDRVVLEFPLGELFSPSLGPVAVPTGAAASPAG
ncbi:MAG TPA: hypothetical protein VJN50_09905 [Actinomycetota bacterium]|nr:hypothetical protein [Actinomycetota bacterium]